MKFLKNLLIKLKKPNTQISLYNDVSSFEIGHNIYNYSYIEFKCCNYKTEIHLNNKSNVKVIEVINIHVPKKYNEETAKTEYIFKLKLFISDIVSKENLPDKISDDFNKVLDTSNIELGNKLNIFVIKYDTIFGKRLVVIKLKSFDKGFIKSEVTNIM